MGLSAAAQEQPCRPPGDETDHDGRTRLVRRPLFREYHPYRQADHDQPRHHPRSWAYRALDHRHVGQAGISHHPGIRRALGHRADVFGFQIARVWSPTDPSALSRPSRPPDIGYGSRPLLGGLDRNVGPRQQSAPGRKKTPGPPAGQARPRKTFLVHPWPPARHQAAPRMPPAPKALEMSDKLIDAQPQPQSPTKITNTEYFPDPAIIISSPRDY